MRARKNQFDFPSEDEIDEEAYDPTRAGSFDLADASQMQFEAANRIKADRALKALRLLRIAHKAIRGLWQG